MLPYRPPRVRLFPDDRRLPPPRRRNHQSSLLATLSFFPSLQIPPTTPHSFTRLLQQIPSAVSASPRAKESPHPRPNCQLLARQRNHPPRALEPRIPHQSSPPLTSQRALSSARRWTSSSNSTRTSSSCADCRCLPPPHRQRRYHPLLPVRNLMISILTTMQQPNLSSTRSPRSHVLHLPSARVLHTLPLRLLQRAGSWKIRIG